MKQLQGSKPRATRPLDRRAKYQRFIESHGIRYDYISQQMGLYPSLYRYYRVREADYPREMYGSLLTVLEELAHSIIAFVESERAKEMETSNAVASS